MNSAGTNVLVRFCQIYTKVTRKEGTSIEELTTSHWPVDKYVGHFLNCQLMHEGSAHCGQCFYIYIYMI